VFNNPCGAFKICGRLKVQQFTRSLQLSMAGKPAKENVPAAEVALLLPQLVGKSAKLVTIEEERWQPQPETTARTWKIRQHTNPTTKQAPNKFPDRNTLPQ
jgi:hypothetical protein